LEFDLFLIESSLPNLYGHIRAHLGTEGASGAGLLLFQAGHGIPLVVDPVAQFNDFFRAGQDAEPAAFTTFFLKMDFGHRTNPLTSYAGVLE
jgi:hypothetical protein